MAQEFILRYILPVSVLAVILSDTVGGFCGRLAFTLPLAWIGILDIETVADFALMYE